MPAITPDNLADPIRPHVRPGATTLRADQTVEQALASLRSAKIEERVVYFYVVDGGEKLVGVVSTRRLLTAGPSQTLAELMDSRVVSVPDTATVLDVCETFVTRRYLALPVVDADGRFLGAVDVSLFTDEVLGFSEQHAATEIFQLIGVSLLEGRRASPWDRFRARFPWLLFNVGGGVACAAIAGGYEEFLGQRVILALFIPVVLTLAESVSMQSMTLTLEPSAGRLWRRLRDEFATALMLGAACGSTVGAIAWAWKGSAAAAAAIAASITLSMATACVLGVALPTLVRWAKRDPKIASGPVVLTVADLATLLFYFRVSAALLR